MSMTVMSRQAQYTLNSRPSHISDEKNTLLYEVLKSHSKMDAKIQAWKVLVQGDQGENDQDVQHDDSLLSTEFTDEPILWSDDDAGTSLEFDGSYADHVPTPRADDQDVQHDDRVLLNAEFGDEPILWSYDDSDTVTPVEYDGSYADHHVTNGGDDQDLQDDDRVLLNAEFGDEPILWSYDDSDTSLTPLEYNDQDNQHDDRILNAELILWSYDANAVTPPLTPLEFDGAYADHVTTGGDSDDDAVFLQYPDDDNNAGTENDFDVDLYAGSALVAAQTNTESDYTDSYNHHYTHHHHDHHSHHHDADVLIDVDDLTLCEYQEYIDDGDNGTYTDTTIVSVDDSQDDENNSDDEDIEIFEEKKVHVFNSDEDDVVLLVDQLLGDDEMLTLQGRVRFLHL